MGDTEVIVWQVRAKLNQSIAFKNYPFDVKNLSIELWHKDFAKNITLIPDFDSYSNINPSALSGINPQMYIYGWNLLSTYFGYKTNPYPTNFGFYARGPFGIYQELNKLEVPELTFNIMAERQLLEIFTTDFVAVVIILILLFITLLVFHKIPYGDTFSTIPAIFFSAIISQMAIQNKFRTSEFVYYETFYFLIYVIFVFSLFIVTWQFIAPKKSKARLDRWYYIQRILYWPVVLGAIFITALIYLF